MKKLKAIMYGVPFVVKGFWPYYHQNFTDKMKAKGFETGTMSSGRDGALVNLLQNESHEFIYEVIKSIKLKGSDFLFGTDYEYDLKFKHRIKRNFNN